MTLFEIDAEIESCVKLESGDFVNTETGEIIDVAALDALKMDRDKKVRNIACWVKNLDAEIKALDEQEKLFRSRKLAKKNKMETLKSYLAFYLNGKKWENKEVTISWRKSEAVEVTNIKQLSSYYLRFKEPEVNKSLLKADLKAGVVLNGAELVTKNNMVVK